VVKKNAVLLGLENCSQIICADAKKLPQNDKFFDLIFVDPPYAEDYLVIIKNLIEKGWISQKSLVVVESQTGKEELSFDGLQLLESRVYGSTSFWFFSKK
jgi:16S rRNA G966 N2-methylase RsmD